MELRLEDERAEVFVVANSYEDQRRLQLWLATGRPLDALARAIAPLLDDDALDKHAA